MKLFRLYKRTFLYQVVVSTFEFASVTLAVVHVVNSNNSCAPELNTRFKCIEYVYIHFIYLLLLVVVVVLEYEKIWKTCLALPIKVIF